MLGLRAFRRFKGSDAWPNNLFKKYPILEPDTYSPIKPIDPFELRYIFNTDRERTIFNREPFIKSLLCNMNERFDFMKANNRELDAPLCRERAYLMGMFGHSGSGKSYALGHLMKVVMDIHDPAEMNEARNYLIDALGDECGINAFETLSRYVVIPLTFNSRQRLDIEVENRASLMILSRVIHSLSSYNLDRIKIYKTISPLLSLDSLHRQIYELLDPIFSRGNKKSRYIFLLDQITQIRDEPLRRDVLRYFGSFMDERASTFVIVTSADAEALLRSVPARRNVRILPLNPVPSLVVNLPEYRSMIDRWPSIAAVLFDRISDPRWIMEYEEVMIDLSRQNLPYWKLFTSAPQIYSVIRPRLTKETVENVSNLLLHGKPICIQSSIGEYCNGDQKHYFSASECLSDNIFAKFNMSAYKEGAWFAENVEEFISRNGFCAEFVPVSNVRTFHEILIKHPNLIKGLHCAAYWALCMTLVNPWIDRFGKVTGEGFEIFDAFNEILHRMGAYHRSDYFACADPKNVTSATFECNHMYKRLPFIAHSSYCVAYMEDEVNLNDIITGMEVINDPATPEADTSDILCRHNSHFAHFKVEKIDHYKSSLEQATNDQLDLFRKGGIILFNILKCCGYDYAIADKKILSFFKCKSSKPKEATAHSRSTLESSDLMNEYEKCSSIFKNLNRRLRPDRKFKGFRLIVKAYRQKPEDIPKFDNLHVFGPEDCLALYPPTFRNMVEMAMLGSPKEAFEALANMMKKH